MQNVGMMGQANMMGQAGMMGQGLPLFNQNSSNLQRFQLQGLNSVNNGLGNQNGGYYQQDTNSGYHTGTTADASHQSASEYRSHYKPSRRTRERPFSSNDARIKAPPNIEVTTNHLGGLVNVPSHPMMPRIKAPQNIEVATNHLGGLVNVPSHPMMLASKRLRI
jgi:hypothetical protein